MQHEQLCMLYAATKVGAKHLDTQESRHLLVSLTESSELANDLLRLRQQGFWLLAKLPPALNALTLTDPRLRRALQFASITELQQ